MIKNIAKILYHIAVVIMSAAIALSLPFSMSFIAQKFLLYWSLIENEKIFLVSVEIGVAILLILAFSYTAKSLRDRRYAGMARSAGLIFVNGSGGLLTRSRVKELKKKQGFAKDIMIIGSTGFRTFVDAKGDLNHAVKNCREAKIMLLDPTSEGASARAKSLNDPTITPETFREQIRNSIDFLKGLKAVQKNIKLKLYQDIPLLKLAIFGDYLSIQYYHAGLDVQKMPEYVLKHTQKAGGLYNYFHQYFHTRWHDPNIPEYDLDTDELVYRDKAGNELRREKMPIFTAEN